MKKISIVLILTTLLSTDFSYAQYTDVINSNRPGKSMMAFSVGKSVIQLESGFFLINENHDLLGYDATGFGVDFAARWGLFKDELEIIAEVQYQEDIYTSTIEKFKRNAIRSTTFGVKYLVYDPNKYYEHKTNIRSWKANQGFKWRQLLPSVAAYAGVIINPNTNPFAFYSTKPTSKLDGKVTLITQNTLGTRWVLVNNFIYSKFASEFPSLEYISTLTHGINQRWSIFIENQGYSSHVYKDNVFRGGAAFLITSDMQVDASFSKNIKNTPSLMHGGLGLSWRFDENYRELRIKSPKDYNKDKKNKSAKERESKKNKRKKEKTNI